MATKTNYSDGQEIIKSGFDLGREKYQTLKAFQKNHEKEHL